MGVNPGRVVWIWNPDATNEKFEHNDFATYDWYFSAHNNNPEVIGNGRCVFADRYAAQIIYHDAGHIAQLKSKQKHEHIGT